MSGGVRELGYTGASEARFMGMTMSGVNRMVRLQEARERARRDK